MMIRRREWMATVGAAVATSWPALGSAQTLDKPVRLVVAYGAGSATDTLARFLSDRISKLGGRPAIVENKSGADGNIAAEAAAHASQDMYTLLVSGSSTHAANAAIYKKLPFDPESDFTPMSILANAPFILLVNPQRVRQRTLKEFMEWARAGSGQDLSFASSSVGNRVAGERFQQVAIAADAQTSPAAPTAQQSRLIGIRQHVALRVDAKGKQLSLFADDHVHRHWRYAALVTSLSLPAQEIWRSYSKLAIRRMSINALALGRQLGVSYKTAWALKRKLMQAMQIRDENYPLRERVEIDDAYLGGERASSIHSGRKAMDKTAFIAAVQTDVGGKPRYMRLELVRDFTNVEVVRWAKRHFNTLLGNLKRSMAGTYHAFDHANSISISKQQ